MTRYGVREMLVTCLLVGSSLPVVEAESQTNGQSSSSVSGTIAVVDVEALSPSLTVADGSGTTSTVLIDRYTTTVTVKDHGGQLSDLKVGQQVQVTGRTTLIGRFLAKSIAITQESAPPAAAPAASSAKTAPAPSAKPKSAPGVLKSIPASEQGEKSSKP